MKYGLYRYLYYSVICVFIIIIYVYCYYFRNKCYMCIYISKSNVLLYKIIFHIYLYDIIKLNFGGTKSGQMC